MIVTVTDLYDGVTPETSPITITVVEGAATTGGGGAVDSVNGHVGVVILDADDLADGTTNHVFTAADDTKLAGIATGATANSSDATLLARANHTGTQAISTVTGLQTALDGKDTALAAHEADTTSIHGIANTANLETVTGSQAKADAAQAASQPLDSDLTAIAALSTTAFGRALLELANAAAGRTALGLGSAAVAATGDFDAAGAAAAAQAASQPLDSDLTALAALSTTSYGRSLLEASNAAALRTLAGLVLGTDIYSKSAVDSGFQPLDSDLTSIAALTTTSYGRAFLALADAAAARTAIGVDASGTAVLKSLFDANTMLYATTDDTPVALTVAASRIVGRKASGDISALTAAEVLTILGISASIGAPSLLLNYRPGADLSINGGSALTANTWTDATANQNFTVANASAVVEIGVHGAIAAIHSVSGNSSQISARIVIDSAGTPQNIVFAGDMLGGTQPRGNFLAGSSPVYLTGLSAAVHTIKVQVFSNIANTSAFCRPVTVNPDVESINITVLQHAA